MNEFKQQNLKCNNDQVCKMKELIHTIIFVYLYLDQIHTEVFRKKETLAYRE